MKANTRWSNQPEQFWDYIRVISEDRKYAKKGKILRHSAEDVQVSLAKMEIPIDPVSHGGALSIDAFVDYFNYRADTIEASIVPNLQTANGARETFEDIVDRYTTSYTPGYNKDGKENSRTYEVIGGVSAIVPYNKQKGVKRGIDFLTGSANILISHHLAGESFDQDPRKLPMITNDGVLVGSIGRRMDGGYPASINPVAVWEFKCYYYTTTFGSKISDAVYITELDGRECQDINRKLKELGTGRYLHSTLFVDSYGVWYRQGPPYLCRLVDELQQGFVDEIVFGREILTAIPRLVDEWKSLTMIQ